LARTDAGSMPLPSSLMTICSHCSGFDHDFSVDRHLPRWFLAAREAGHGRLDPVIDDVTANMHERENEVLHGPRQDAGIRSRVADRLDLLAHDFGEVAHFALEHLEAFVDGDRGNVIEVLVDQRRIDAAGAHFEGKVVNRVFLDLAQASAAFVILPDQIADLIENRQNAGLDRSRPLAKMRLKFLVGTDGFAA
jgi:hypothetical protein